MAMQVQRMRVVGAVVKRQAIARALLEENSCSCGYDLPLTVKLLNLPAPRGTFSNTMSSRSVGAGCDGGLPKIV